MTGRVSDKDLVINRTIRNYIDVNRVDVGQDISFIISRLFLIVTLVSLAVTSLKIILSEIRFVNRLNELRIASAFILIHPDRNLLHNLYKVIGNSKDIGKEDAEIGLSVKDARELIKGILHTASKIAPGT